MEPPSTRPVFVANPSEADIDTLRLAETARFALHLAHADPGEIVIVLTTSAEVRKLNAKFRKVDEDTDVLTFPTGGNDSSHLGEIYISVPYATEQAALRGWPVCDEIGHLVVHGCLHLAGYDDEQPADRRKMLKAQNMIAARAGLPIDHEWSSLLHEVRS